MSVLEIKFLKLENNEVRRIAIGYKSVVKMFIPTIFASGAPLSSGHSLKAWAAL